MNQNGDNQDHGATPEDFPSMMDYVPPVGGTPEWIEEVLNPANPLWKRGGAGMQIGEALAILHQKIDRLLSLFDGFENVRQVGDKVYLCADCLVAKGARHDEAL